MGRVILDSSVLIAATSSLDVHHSAAIAALHTKNDYFASVITLAEVLSFPMRENPTKAGALRNQLKSLFTDFIDVNEGIAVRAAEIRSTSSIKLPDALISATAALHKLELWTFDKQLAKATKGARLLK
mgnify:CR=1 FL=1